MKKEQLLLALEKVKPALAKNDTIEQSTSFAFMNDCVVTFNNEISISHKVPNLNLTGAIKAEELYKFLSKIKTDDIELATVDNEIRIKSGKAKIGLTIESEIKLPLSELGKIEKWHKLPEDFLPTLEIVRFCCSKEMTKPKLTCVHVRKDGVLEACDNYRAIQFQMKSKSPIDFLLPVSSANLVIGYLVNTIAESPGWVHFADKEKNLIFSCRVYCEDYIDLTNNFILTDGIPFIFPKESIEILERAQIFSKGDSFINQQVQVSVEGRRLFFRVKKAGSWFEEWVKISDIQDFSTLVHPQFLQDILKLTTTCEIAPGRIIKFTGENWQHIAAMSTPI